MVAALKIPDFLTVGAFLTWDAPMGCRSELPPRLEFDRGSGSRDLAINPGIVPRVQSDINLRIPDLAVTCSPALPTDKA